MPEFIFTGASGRHYPESRDALGVPVGQAEPGDTRDFDAPLDSDWLPVTPPAGEKPAPKTKTTAKAGSTGEEG